MYNSGCVKVGLPKIGDIFGIKCIFFDKIWCFFKKSIFFTVFYDWLDLMYEWSFPTFFFRTYFIYVKTSDKLMTADFNAYIYPNKVWRFHRWLKALDMSWFFYEIKIRTNLRSYFNTKYNPIIAVELWNLFLNDLKILFFNSKYRYIFY